VIIGQDPYHGPGQAHGFAFSVPPHVAIPPSLKNIYRELNADLDQLIPPTGDLTHWARQGVLLINSTLSVEQGKAGAHQKFGWERFTNAVIQTISEQKEFVVFLLWGTFAQKKSTYINTNQHAVLKAGHPSPLSANRGHWFGNRHFSTTNTLLRKHNLTPIDW
jgi:uracil-DNA glycosylase